MSQPPYEELLAQFQELHLAVRTLRDENQSLREAMRVQPLPTEDVPAPQQPAMWAATVQRPRPRMPDPAPFTGDDSTLYPQFEAKLTAKIEVDKDAIGDDHQLMWYAFSRLEGKAAARVLPWIQTKQETDPGSLNWRTFKDFLRTTFSDPERRTKAISQLNTIKQRGKDLREFLGEFDQLLLEAGGLSWDDDVKKGYLDSALNRELLRGLVGVQAAASYEDYCRQVQKINEQIQRANNADRRYTYATKQNPLEGKSLKGPDAMEWEPARVGTTRTKTRDLQDRRRLGLCFRCGEKGHKAMDCNTDKRESGKENP